MACAKAWESPMRWEGCVQGVPRMRWRHPLHAQKHGTSPTAHRMSTTSVRSNTHKSRFNFNRRALTDGSAHEVLTIGAVKLSSWEHLKAFQGAPPRPPSASIGLELHPARPTSSVGHVASVPSPSGHIYDDASLWHEPVRVIRRPSGGPRASLFVSRIALNSGRQRRCVHQRRRDW